MLAKKVSFLSLCSKSMSSVLKVSLALFLFAQNIFATTNSISNDILNPNNTAYDVTFTNDTANQIYINKTYVEVDQVVKEIEKIANALVPRDIELANCSTSTGCPINAVQCDAVTETPYCPDGSILNTARDMCQKDPDVFACPDGFTYDKDLKQCVKPLDCPNGGTYVVSRNRCEYKRIYECPAGYTQSGNTCIAPPVCPNNATFNATLLKCTLNPTFQCADAGWTYDPSTNKCFYAPPTCPTGYSYNKQYDVCLLNYTVSCPSGAIYDATTDSCLASYTPTCATGYTYNSTRSRCEKTPPDCPSGSTYNATTNRCEHAYEKISLNTQQGSWSACNGTTVSAYRENDKYFVKFNGGNWQQWTGTRLNGPMTYGSCWRNEGEYVAVTNIQNVPSETPITLCESGISAPGGISAFQNCTTVTSAGFVLSLIGWDAYNGDRFSWQITISNTQNYKDGCTNGFLDSGTNCYLPTNPTCPSSGTYDGTNDVCFLPYTKGCTSGTLLPGLDICVENATCTKGSLNKTLDRCEQDYQPVCGTGWTFNSTTNMCEKDPFCVVGTYNKTLDKCTLDFIKSCPSGYSLSADSTRCELSPSCASGTTYNPTTNRCEKVITCPTGSTWDATLNSCTVNSTCTSPATLNTTTNRCEYTTSSNNCPSGTTFNSVSGLCTVIPTCPSGGVYDTAKNLCTSASTGISCVAGYMYNATYATCVATPICSQGTYSTTYNACLLSYTPTCASGYTYNATRSRCEKTPPDCPSGTTYNATTNRCEQGINSACTISGGTWNGSSCSVDGTYSAIKGVKAGITYVFATSDNCGGNFTGYYATTTGTLTNGIPDVTFSPQNGCGTASMSYSGNSTLAWTSGRRNCTGWYRFTGGGSSHYSSCTNNISFNSDTCTISNSVITYGTAKVTWTNTITDACSYTCPNGGTLSGTTCNTSASVAPSCPVGYTHDGNGKCYANPTCPSSGSFDGNLDVCWLPFGKSCPSGMTYDSASNSCVANAICSSGGILNSSIDQCTISGTNNCQSGYGWNTTYSTCTASASCVTGTTLNTSTDNCQVSGGYTCNSSFSLSGTTCYQTPSCTVGTYSTTNKKCDAGSSTSCTGLTLDTSKDICYASSTCLSGGNFDTTADKCWFSYSPTCTSGTYDATSLKCTLDAICDGGALNTSLDKCQISREIVCAQGVKDSATGKCTFTANCQAGATLNSKGCNTEPIPLTCPSGTDTALDMCFSDVNACKINSSYPSTLASTLTYSDALNICIVDENIVCAPSLTWSANYLKCEAVPICYNGMYNPENDFCYIKTKECPINASHPCKGPIGNQWCSPYECNPKTNQCGYAECPGGIQPSLTAEMSPSYNANLISNSSDSLCTEPYCNIANSSRFTYCGLEAACPSGFGVFEQNSKCFVRECPKDSFQENNKCYSLGCPKGTTEQGSGKCLVN